MSAADPTAEEKQRWLAAVAEAAANNDAPDPRAMPGFQEPAPSVVQSVGKADDGSFGAEDLDGEDVGAGRKFPMPKGKHLYIFPLSGAELRTLAKWTGRIDPGFHKDDSELQRAAKVQEANEEAKAYQVILCCFRDEERRVRCFEREDVGDVMHRLRGSRIARICQISDEAAGEGIDQGFGDLRSFFSRAQGCLNEWLSVSAGWADCPATLKEQTRGLISL